MFNIICIASLGTILPTVTVLSIILLKKQHKHAIRGRLPSLIIINVVILSLYALSKGLVFLLGSLLPCWFDYVFSNSLIAFSTCVYTTRIFRLLFKFEVEGKLSEYKRNSVPENKESIPKPLTSGTGGWFIKHRHMMSATWLTKFTAIYFLFSATPLFAVGIMTVNCDFTFAELVNYSVQGFQLSLIMIAAIALGRHEHDAFYIKYEFRLVLAGVLCILSFYMIRTNINILKENLFVEYCESAFSVCFFTGCSVVFPLWLSRNTSDINLCDVGKKQVETLRDLLLQPRGFESFMKYLKTEFSSENGLFWKAVEEYRNKSTKLLKLPNKRQLVLKHCQEIYDEFILPGALMEVNLCAKNKKILKNRLEKHKAITRKKVSNQMSKYIGRIQKDDFSDLQLDEEKKCSQLPQLFNESQEEIYTLMQRDSLQRYLKSKIFQEWKETAHEDNIEISVDRIKRNRDDGRSLSATNSCSDLGISREMSSSNWSSSRANLTI